MSYCRFMMRVAHKPPFFYPLVSLIVGISAQYYAKIPIELLLVFVSLVVVCIGISVVADQPDWVVIGFVILLCSVGGAALLALQQGHHQNLSHLYGNKPLDVRGVVIDREFRVDGKYPEIITVHVRAVQSAAERSRYWSTSFIMYLYVPAYTSCLVDDEIRLWKITMRHTNAQGLSGNQSFQDFLIKEGVLGTAFLWSADQVHLVRRPTVSWARSLWLYRQKFLDTLASLVSRRTFHYVTTMFLGNRAEDDAEEMRTLFGAWGTIHYLARSGLHIVLFLTIWRLFLSWVPLPIRFKQIILLLIAGGYTALSWSSVSFLRALYVFVALQVGAICLFMTHFLHLLSLVCFVLLLSNPMNLFFLDFQLTFLLTAVLSLYAPAL